MILYYEYALHDHPGDTFDIRYALATRTHCQTRSPVQSFTLSLGFGGTRPDRNTSGKRKQASREGKRV